MVALRGLRFLLCAACLVAPVAAQGWLEDERAATQRASREQRLQLLFFCGSDWCRPAQVFEAKVLAAPRVQTWMRSRFVPLRVDFPRHTKVDPAVRERRKRLAKACGVRDFPSLVIRDPGGKLLLLQRASIQTPDAFIKALQKAIEKADAARPAQSAAVLRARARALGRTGILLLRPQGSDQARAALVRGVARELRREARLPRVVLGSATTLEGRKGSGALLVHGGREHFRSFDAAAPGAWHRMLTHGWLAAGGVAGPAN